MLGACSTPAQLPSKELSSIATAMLQAFSRAGLGRGGMSRAGQGGWAGLGRGGWTELGREETGLGWAGAGRELGTQGCGE